MNGTMKNIQDSTKTLIGPGSLLSDVDTAAVIPLRTLITRNHEPVIVSVTTYAPARTLHSENHTKLKVISSYLWFSKVIVVNKS